MPLQRWQLRPYGGAGQGCCFSLGGPDICFREWPCPILETPRTVTVALLTPVPHARRDLASVRPTTRGCRAPRGPRAAVGLRQRPAPARVQRGHGALSAQGTPGEGT